VEKNWQMEIEQVTVTVEKVHQPEEIETIQENEKIVEEIKIKEEIEPVEIKYEHCDKLWDEDLNFCGKCGEKLDKRKHLNWKSTFCDEKKIPKYEVNLDDPASTRWDHVMKDYKDKFPELVEYIEKEIAKTLGTTLTFIGKSLANNFLSLVAKSGAAYLAEELNGISKATGIGVGLLLGVQLAYELCACCTSIIAQDSNGIPYHVRTMDWELAMLKNFTIDVDFMKNGKVLYSAATWAGYIGILTGMKPHSFSISINYRQLGKSPLNNLINTISMHWPVGYVVRQCLQTYTIYGNAVDYLQKALLISPVYITVCGTSKDQGCLITRSPSKSEHFISLKNGLKSEQDGNLVYLAQQEKFIVQPNCDWWLLNDIHDKDTILWSKSRVTQAIKFFNKMSTINEEEIANSIYVFHPIVNAYTVYITAMVPSKAYISTRLSK
jgi:N-acylethanolamine-hydrolysing acid amidase